ncbi:hypothetical protein EUV02_12640 [Polymorphobacter arshaanensis]|uniref:Energy transducer TonB n=1 Tax=Glacieibacterium arshaanense TaxID=2511025 RepID=A0A4Y9EK42_9SPHN|nr:hypothetical protein [Polymorphobacter arshaanensis]TFU01152.1 hypothetical protein EUV02_12640 [Polymorphobacter arshaanensis]
MTSAVADWWAEQRESGVPRRVLGFLFVVLVHAVLGYMLFVLAPTVRKKLEDIHLIESRNVPAERIVKRPSPTAHKATPKPEKQPPSKPPPPPPPTDITFGPQLDQPLDISKLPNHRNELAQTDGSDTPAPYGPGQGPGGEPLYNAEWVREPSHAELAGYLPQGAPSGSWAEIACRTVEGNRVEDCQELEESPRGSRLGSALREAAWQFRVRPPRKGGKPLWGTWVRIRFDFTDSGERQGRR